MIKFSWIAKSHMAVLCLVVVALVSCTPAAPPQPAAPPAAPAAPATPPVAGQPAADAAPALPPANVGGPGYSWETPDGWQMEASTPMRLANFKIGADTECYLTVLRDGGGGLEANVNRWRAQMSLPPYTPEELADLKTVRVLDSDGLIVEFSGTYVGMSGTENKAGQKLLGAIVNDGSAGLFIKMVGPEAVVNTERGRFIELCESIQRQSGTEVTAPLKPSPPPMIAAPPKLPAPVLSPTADLAWSKPDTWSEGPEKTMRLVTFLMGDSGKTECYVSVLGGAAGGVEANINRWQQQMGQPPLDAAAIEALPKMAMLGQTVPYVEIAGSFSGMGGTPESGYMLLGAVCPLDDKTVFVKLTGPGTEVSGERERFGAFCESLKQE